MQMFPGSISTKIPFIKQIHKITDFEKGFKLQLQIALH